MEAMIANIAPFDSGLWTAVEIILFVGFFAVFNATIELAAFFAMYRKKVGAKAYATVALANLVSYPVFFTAFMLAERMWIVALFAVLIVFEAVVVVFEGYALHYFNKKQFSLKRALKASLVTNIVSFVMSFVIMVLL